MADHRQRIKTIRVENDPTALTKAMLGFNPITEDAAWVEAGGTGLYKGVETPINLIAIPFNDLTDAFAYFVNGEFLVWDAAATEGIVEPTDKPNPGVDPGWWVTVGGDAIPPMNVLEWAFTDGPIISIANTALPMLVEVDTNAGNVTINLPEIIDNKGKVIIKNIGTGDVTVNAFTGQTLMTVPSFDILEGYYFTFISDLATTNWFNSMKETPNNAIQDYFFGMYAIVGPSGTPSNGTLMMDIINLASNQLIDYPKYTAVYIPADGGGLVAHSTSGAVLLDSVTFAGIHVIL